MEFKIPIITVGINDMESLIEDLGHLQTYKLFEDADRVLVDVDDVIKVLKNHVEVQRKEKRTGWWVDELRETEFSDCGLYETACICSVCGADGDDEYNFCPNCGAKMKEVLKV